LRSQKHGPASVVHENGGIYRKAAKHRPCLQSHPFFWNGACTWSNSLPKHFCIHPK
jgi:hypothetical protein